MPEDLIIVGAGGFGREAVDVAEAMRSADGTPTWNVLGVADDRPSEPNLTRLSARGLRYLGTTSDVLAGAMSAYVVGIGSPATRRDLVGLFDRQGWSAAVLVHPAASLGTEVMLGPGTVICAGARLTTNIRLGQHVHVNPNATIGHDTTLGDFVSVNPAASISGDCTVEDGVLIGVQGVVLNRLTVGTDALVGAAACVTSDVAPGTTVVGVPARTIRAGVSA